MLLKNVCSYIADIEDSFWCWSFPAVLFETRSHHYYLSQSVYPVTLMMLCLPVGALGERICAKPSFTITPRDLSLDLQVFCDKALGQHSHFPYSMDALM